MKTVFTDLVSAAKPKKVVVDDYVKSVYEILGGIDNDPKRTISFTGSVAAGRGSTAEGVSHSFGNANRSKYDSFSVGQHADPFQHYSFVISFDKIAQRSITVRKAVTFGDPSSVSIPLLSGTTQLISTRIVAVEPYTDATWSSVSFERDVLVDIQYDNATIIENEARWGSVNLVPNYNEKVDVSFGAATSNDPNISVGTNQSNLVINLLDDRDDVSAPLYWAVFFDATEVNNYIQNTES